MRLAWHHQESSGHCQLCRESTIFLHPFCWKIPYALPPLLWFNLIFFSCHHWNHLPTYSFDSPPPILLHVFVFRLLCVLHKSNPLIFFDVCLHAHVTNIQANFRVHTHICVCVCVCLLSRACLSGPHACVGGCAMWVPGLVNKRLSQWLLPDSLLLFSVAWPSSATSIKHPGWDAHHCKTH